LILEKTPLLLLTVGCSLLTLLLQRGAMSSLAQEPLMLRLFNAWVSYWQYVEKTIWPAGLCAIYPLRSLWTLGEVVAATLGLVSVSIAAIRLRRRSPYLLAGWLWFLGTLVPVIGLVQVGVQGMADRYSYIPSIGLFIMICWGVFDLAQLGAGALGSKTPQRREQWIPGALALVALAACGFATNRQLQYWKDSGALFARALAVCPNNRIALASHGLFLYEQKRFPEAIRELQKDVGLFPQDPLGHAFLGDAFYSAGDRDAAAAEFRAALSLRPGMFTAAYGLATLLLEQNLPGEAAAQCAIALQYDPQDARLHCLMGKVLTRQGRLEEAQAQFAEALRLYPQFSDAHYRLAGLLSRQHKTVEAIEQYRLALRFQPAMPEALNDLAWILATDSRPEIRNGAEAVQLARRACALTRNAVPLMVGTLAAAHAETGDFDQAIACAQQARDLAVAQHLDRVAARNVELLALYRSHRAFRE
jgi:Flp pilus assembly protein TadD